MIGFGGGVCKREGAGVLRDCDGIVFVELGKFTKFFRGRGIREKSVTGFSVFASGDVVAEFGFEAGAEEEYRGFVTFFFGGPFFRGDPGRFFVVGGIPNVFDDAGRVVEGAMERGVVAGFFKELDGEKGDGHVFGSEGDDSFGVGSGFGSVAELEAGFDESAENLRTFGGLGIFLQEILEIAYESGAVAAGGFDALLEFVGGGELFGGGLGGGGFFWGSGRVLRRRLGEQWQCAEEEGGGEAAAEHRAILYEGGRKRGGYNERSQF